MPDAAIRTSWDWLIAMVAERSRCDALVGLSLALLCLPMTALAQEAGQAEQPAEPPAEEVAPAEAVPPVPKVDFEAEELDSRWSALDAEAKLAVTREPANVATGRGALEFAYSPRQGVFEQIAFSGLGVEEANALRLKVKTSSPTSVSLGIEEQDGAVYQGLLWIGADSWVAVDAYLDELILAENSADGNNRLDPDQVRAFFLADLANLPGEAGRALGLKEGEQRLWLDDVELAQVAKARRRSRVDKLGDEWLLVVDGFEDDVPWVLPIREAGLAFVNGAPKAQGKRALEMTYTLDKGRWVGFVCAPPGRFDLSAGTDCHMWVRASLSARMVLVLEERDGSKYERAFKPEPDDKWQAVRLPVNEFLMDDDAADENAQLDVGQVHRLILLVDTFDADVTPMGSGSIAVDDIGIVIPARPEGVE